MSDKQKQEDGVKARIVKVGDDQVEVFGDATDAEARAWLKGLDEDGDGQTADEVLKGKKKK